MNRTTSILVISMLVRGSTFAAPLETSGRQPDFAEIEKARLEDMKKNDPQLYGFESRLGEIRQEIGRIADDYSKKKLGKAAAVAKLIPLVKEEQSLRNDPNYMAEQRLYYVLLAQRRGGFAPDSPMSVPPALGRP